jgi:spermidine/putrescine transport system permease protein
MVLVLFFGLTDESGKFTTRNLCEVFLYPDVFLRSLWLGFKATAICLVVGYLSALIISRLNVKLQKILIILVMLPMWMNFLLKIYSLMFILQDNGFINGILSSFGFSKFNMMNTEGAVILGMVYNFLTYMILPIHSSLVEIDEKLLDAAKDLGANYFMTFVKVIFPLSIPGIVSGIAMVFIPSVSTFILSKMLGGRQNFLVGDIIDMHFLGGIYDPHIGSAISLVLMILLLICTGIINQLQNENKSKKGALVI